jgi:hypothetical protein
MPPITSPGPPAGASFHGFSGLISAPVCRSRITMLLYGLHALSTSAASNAAGATHEAPRAGAKSHAVIWHPLISPMSIQATSTSWLYLLGLALVLWIACGATMAIGRRVWGLETALRVHLAVAPIVAFQVGRAGV